MRADSIPNKEYKATANFLPKFRQFPLIVCQASEGPTLRVKGKDTERQDI